MRGANQVFENNTRLSDERPRGVPAILDTWERDGAFREWFAVDSFNPENGEMRRLYVGDPESACTMAARRAAGYDLTTPSGDSLAAPGKFGAARFYRATLIDSVAARDYFLAFQIDEADSNLLVSVSQAANELGITRQGVHDLVRRGVLPSELFDGEYRIGRYSILVRLAGKPAQR